MLCHRSCSNISKKEFVFQKYDPGHYSAMMSVKGKNQKTARKRLLKYDIKAKESFH